MAISSVEHRIFCALREQRKLSRDLHLMELGEQNWYGDIGPELLFDDIKRFAPPQKQVALADRLRAALAPPPRPEAYHEVASVFYATFLDVAVHDAIDMHGTARAQKLDLNYPLDLGKQYDFVMNGGTSEHVFDVCQFFRTVHQITKPGGLMFHAVPFQGWVDHGFYNFQPTFFYDLAIANGYQLVGLFYTEALPTKIVQIKSRQHWQTLINAGGLGKNSMICAVLRRGQQEKFMLPIQAVYAESGATDELVATWFSNRRND